MYCIAAEGEIRATIHRMIISAEQRNVFNVVGSFVSYWKSSGFIFVKLVRWVMRGSEINWFHFGTDLDPDLAPGSIFLHFLNRQRDRQQDKQQSVAFTGLIHIMDPDKGLDVYQSYKVYHLIFNFKFVCFYNITFIGFGSQEGKKNEIKH